MSVGDFPARRLIVLDVLAALVFTLLPWAIGARVSGGGVDGVTEWLLAIGAGAPLAVRRIWPVPVFVVVFAVSCVAVPLWLGPTSLLAAAYALYIVAASTPRLPRVSAPVAGGISVVGAVTLMLTGARHSPGGTYVSQLVLGLMVICATWAAGAAIRERREGARRVIEQATERAKAAERLRVARDIHDVVTHSVGLIAVKASVANHVLPSHPEEAREALQVIEQISRKALGDMRATLKVLRTEGDRAGDTRPDPGLADLPALVSTAETAGVQVEMETRHTEDVPDAVALSAFRIVQEALTNVVKHAAPTQCRVEVCAGNGNVTIGIRDDGPGPGHRPRGLGGGLGIAGMRERAAAHGGTLTAGPRAGGGFEVHAVLRY